ncbi:ATP-binding protein [Sphingomonas aracearum]|nr:ATP-binding protein [Sphingomonas aracearum]
MHYEARLADEGGSRWWFLRTVRTAWRWLTEPRDVLFLDRPIASAVDDRAPVAAEQEALAPTPAQKASDQHQAVARVIAAFDAAHPIRQRSKLHGRADKLEELFNAVLLGRQHALVYGARGSGKTSLAQIFGDHADQRGAVVIYTACEASTNFSELIAPYLGHIPPSCVPLQERGHFERWVAQVENASTPRVVVDALAPLLPDRQIIFIFDEFDRVEDAHVANQVATFLKLLSDAQLPVSVLIVGIADTLDELLQCHPSLRRHMAPIPIGRIADEDIAAIIDDGAGRASVVFDAASRAEIVRVARGSPYHAQLFCYVAALEAVQRRDSRIDLPLLIGSLDRAFATWELLNPDDAALFRSAVARSAPDLTLIEDAARSAAMHDSFAASPPVAALLGESLRQAGRAGNRLAFRDAVAPQMLLALIAIERAKTGKQDGASFNTFAVQGARIYQGGDARW